MYKIALFIITFCLLISCKKTEDAYSLKSTEQYFRFSIDEETKMPRISIFPFESKDGIEYISFQNDSKPEILFYDIRAERFVTKISFMTEGPNAIIGGFWGYYIKDFNTIYIQSLYTNTAYSTDTTKRIKQIISFEKTDKGQRLIPFLQTAGVQIVFDGSNLYVPQTINPMLKDRMMEDSPVGVSIDTINKSIKALPMKFPSLISFKDFGTPAASGLNYSRCFDGKHFIYAFQSSDKLYKANISHEEIEEVESKSKYIDKVSTIQVKSDNLNDVLKRTCEQASYGNLVYDKYRKVYYRFAYPETELEANENYMEILHSGRKVFSVMILDENLQVIGETLFPEYTYSPNLFLVLKDGLYISTNHIKNPNYSEDVLCFQRFELKKNE